MSGSGSAARGQSCGNTGASASCGMPEREALTERQRRFVEAYMGKAGGNGTEAARVAGYTGTPATLGAIASENLKKPKIRAAIQARQRADPLVMTREAVLQRLSALGRGESVVPLCDRATGHPVPDVSVPPPVAVQLKAMELLGKLCGWFKESEEPNDRLRRFLEVLSQGGGKPLERPRG